MIERPQLDIAPSVSGPPLPIRYRAEACSLVEMSI